MSFDELVQFLRTLGSGEGRARNLFKALHRHEAPHPLLLPGVAKELRLALGRAGHYVSPLSLQQVSVSRSSPGTRKFLFFTRDGLPVESVLMPAGENRTTVCLSCQSGCRMGCAFCCTGRMGLLRDLTCAEIVSQFTFIADTQRRKQANAITNVVFMGMGEPFDNFDNVMKAFNVLNNRLGPGISRDRITISTCGIVKGIDALAKLNIRTNLAISLNAPDDELRTRLMPVNRRWPLKSLIGSLKRFPLRPGRVFYIEYILLKGVNDSPEHARALTRLLAGIPFKLNIIRFNPVPPLPFRAPEPSEVSSFASMIEYLSKGTLVRHSFGGDIAAACGQLGLSFIDKSCKFNA